MKKYGIKEHKDGSSTLYIDGIPIINVGRDFSGLRSGESPSKYLKRVHINVK